LIFTVFLTTKIITAGIVEFKCIEIDTDYYGADIKTILNVPDWQTCARHCQNLAACAKWSWVSPKFQRSILARKRCYLKSGDMAQVYKDQHLVSGVKSAYCPQTS